MADRVAHRLGRRTPALEHLRRRWTCPIGPVAGTPAGELSLDVAEGGRKGDPLLGRSQGFSPETAVSSPCMAAGGCLPEPRPHDSDQSSAPGRLTGG